MLADYQLDTEIFQDILDDAKNMVASLYPEWTDFNYHDPGITMLELFAWMKEGQQYFLDQVGTEHRKKYLKLLQISGQHRQPARAYVDVEAPENMAILQGTKLYAGSVQFETEYRQCIVHNRITQCFHGDQKLQGNCIGGDIGKNANLRLQIFGPDPKPGDAWYIGFEKPLAVQEMIGIRIHLAKPQNGIRRNRLRGPLYAPMLELDYEYYANGKWMDTERLRDDTYGMLEDGMLYLSVRQRMELVSIYGREAYYIRICVRKSDMDVPPILEGIQLNALALLQQDTWAGFEEKKVIMRRKRFTAYAYTRLGVEGTNELYLDTDGIYYPVEIAEKYVREETGKAKFIFRVPERMYEKGSRGKLLIVSYADQPKLQKCLGIGTGMPFQEYDLPSRDVMFESVEILVHEIGSQGGFARWKRVEDFGASAPEDKHFTVDVRKGRICFGDCEHGMAPEGEILLISFAVTQGEEGNVKKGTIRMLDGIHTDGMRADGISVSNAQDAWGGRDEEGLEDCFFRARRRLKMPETAVTYADYERRVQETPGLIVESCRAIPVPEMKKLQEGQEGNTLSIVVKAGGKRGLTESYRKNILAHLEKYRLLGTRIQIIAPYPVRMEVFLDIAVKPHYRLAKEQIRQTVEEYFGKLAMQFGPVVVYSELYGRIDMLECVAAVHDMTLDVRDGKAVRLQDGNILLPPHGTAQLGQVHQSLSLADENM